MNFEKNMPTNYADACCVIYNEYLKIYKPDALIWGDKNNFYINHIELLNGLYPSARFIYIIRDPRDVACSYREVACLNSASIYKPNLSVDPAEIARQWLSNNMLACESLKRINQRQRLQVRYEDLTQEPKKTLLGICSFLELDFEEKMLDFHLENKKNHLEPLETIDWKKKTLHPITSSQVGRFKVDLSREQTAVIESITRDYMAGCGYFCS